MQGGININGQNAKSKAAIKRAVANGDRVTFYCTDAFGPNAGKIFDLAAWPVTGADGRHVFVGPDPYTKRVYYGNIVARNGEVKVS
jgi:hypothetical protein